jgi:NhaP-type Na+/H+ or K+/H+ antiporter
MQIMILAWPGVIVSFLLIGACAYFFFPYGWSWSQCLLLGAVHSATDPVAVLAGLHQVPCWDPLYICNRVCNRVCIL